jgi:hypothetical protein
MKTVFRTRPAARFFVTLLACGAIFLEIRTAVAGPSVVGLWRFDEGSGTNVADSSGLGHNGTITGENGNVPVWVGGQAGFGSALQFTDNGADHSYVTIPGAASLMIGQTATNPWSMTAWVYESSGGTGDFIAAYGRVLATDGGNAFEFESGASGDAEMYTWSEINAQWQLPWGTGNSVSPLLDQWVHWAVVYDGANLTIYRNANQGLQGGVSSVPLSSPLGFSGYTGSILIGSELDQAGNTTWNGMLDDVAVFAGALTQAQVATVMSGNFSSFIGGPAGIVSQPQSQAVPQGSTVMLAVGADGLPPFNYQWFEGTNKLSNAGNPTTTSATLILTNVQPGQSGSYSVVVSNALGGAVTSQAAALSVFNGNLVGLWRFDDGSGTNAADSSGLGNNGVLGGENGNVPAWVPGQPGFGSALRFTNNGTDHAFVAVPANGSLLIGQTATNPWTITAWAYEDSDGTGDFVANYGRVLVIDDGTALQLESGAQGDGEFYTWARANGQWQLPWGISSSVSPLLDQWEHWAVVYDGTNLTVYRDGNTGPNGGVSSQPVNAPLGGYPGFSDAITIGTELAQTGDRNWNGMLDDVAVFNIALSQSQIQAVMSGDFSAFLAGPTLAISTAPGHVILSWPASQSGLQLQSSASLPVVSWGNVTNAPATNGNAIQVTVPIGAGNQFFRLVGP